MNKKGFTLIELVAVILILGIIALIAIPAVSNVINDSKKHAAEVTALSYIKSIDDQNALYKLQPDKFTPIQSGNVDDLIVNIKGDGPTSGTVTVTNGKVSAAELCITGYNATYNGKTVTIGTRCGDSSSTPAVVFNGTYEAPQEGDTHKGIVYLNPTALETVCDESNSLVKVWSTGIVPNESGCMRFYIFENSGNTYKMILDHNTSRTVWITESDYLEAGGTQEDWNANIRNNKGPITALKRLAEDTENWIGNPRLMTSEEVRTITRGPSTGAYYFGSLNNTNYANQTEEEQARQTSYAWLFNYLSDCLSYGCTIKGSNYGYWLNDAWTSNSSQRYMYQSSISKSGDLDGAISVNYGVRPVIELPKSLFE